jgi:hypothetical protein
MLLVCGVVLSGTLCIGVLGDTNQLWRLYGGKVRGGRGGGRRDGWRDVDHHDMYWGTGKEEGGGKEERGRGKR